jgi:molecular chaperone HscB
MGKEEEQLDDPELIMEVMEAREELEEATSQEQVEEIRQRTRGEHIPALIRQCAQAHV